MSKSPDIGNREQVFAILRLDLRRPELSRESTDAIAVTEVVPTQEQAVNEVKRLAALNKDKGVFYFWQATRLYGRRGPKTPHLETKREVAVEPQSLGEVAFPSDFPRQAYEAVGARVVTHAQGHPIEHAEALEGFWGAWSGVAYRFTACTKHDEAFTQSVLAAGSAPAFPQRQEQDEHLFEFFVSAYSTLECFAGAVWAVIDLTRGTMEQRGVSREGRFATLRDVAKRLHQRWPDELLSRQVNELVRDHTYFDLRHVRNVLVHRALPGRSFFVGGENDRQATWIGLNVLIDVNTTKVRRLWMAQQLAELLPALDHFIRRPKFE